MVSYLPKMSIANVGRTNVWTNECRVLTKVNNKIVVISSLDELNKY